MSPAERRISLTRLAGLLLELCGLVQARVIDMDGVYDPCRPSDKGQRYATSPPASTTARSQLPISVVRRMGSMISLVIP
jgi:hypothetical protein